MSGSVLDEADLETMFADSAGVLATFGAESTSGHFENPTGEIFDLPVIVASDRVFVCKTGELSAGIDDELVIEAANWVVRDFRRESDGGITYFLLGEGTP